MMLGCKAAAQWNWCERQMPTDNPADPADQPRDRRRSVPECTHRGMAPIYAKDISASETEARPAPGFTFVTVAIPDGVRARPGRGGPPRAGSTVFAWQ